VGGKVTLIRVILEALNYIIRNIESFSIIAASIAAIWGVNSWRREAKWKRKYELGEEVLSLFYEVRDKIRFIRNPFSSPDEGKSRKPSENETPQEKEALDRAFITIERYHKCSEIFNKLNSLQYRFMAIFGKNAITPFKELNKLLKNIIITSEALGFSWSKLSISDKTIRDNLIKKIQDYEKIIWAGYEDDPIESKVNEIIKEIENICGPILKEKKRNFFTLNILV